jgi:hypothetical protein
MRILIAIPHYYRPTTFAPDGRAHGSVNRDPTPRIAALGSCLQSLQTIVAPKAFVLDHASRLARHIESAEPVHLNVIICTTGENHLLKDLTVTTRFWSQHDTQADPPFLGYECHAVLRDNLDKYDFYGYLEDDLILTDPGFFRKLLWFNRLYGDTRVLQPNRYEAGVHPEVDKFYVDGNLPAHCISQSNEPSPLLISEVLGRPIVFRTGTNPHAGCFFLTNSQMAYWSRQSSFLDRSASFIGALESAATLGLMNNFSVYKPGLENADFLEIQHYGNAYLSMLGRKPH